MTDEIANMASTTSESTTTIENGYVLLPREPKTDPEKIFHYTDLQRSKPTRENDPYEYLQGWGNRHQSEVIPGTLPAGQNNPQEVRFGLYTEGFTYSAFAAPRHANMSTYIYRVRPAAAHNGYKPIPQTTSHIENCFLSPNSCIAALPSQAEWTPFPLPPASTPINFINGLHTLCGSGDPNIREGIALYVYMINTSMKEPKQAFCNQDGDFLLVPQLGSLDIQTEFGRLYLQPGEIFVVQRGVRFAINLAEGTKEARGYITEVWGSMWELPDLGPIGGHGLANPRDFLFPTAHIDEELHGEWEVVCKLNGGLHGIQQDHSPFDLVAWHGNVVPYKYFHRNSASEFLASLYGNGLGISDDFQPGGGSFEGGHTPHGGFSEGYLVEMKLQENRARRILEDQMTIMIESSRTFLFTEYARTGCGTLHAQGTDPKVWDKLPDKFSTYPGIKELLQRVKEDKKAARARAEYYHDPKIGRFPS